MGRIKDLKKTNWFFILSFSTLANFYLFTLLWIFDYMNNPALDNLRGPILTSLTSIILAATIYFNGTRFLDHQKAINQFHKQYIDLRNKLSERIIDLRIGGEKELSINDLKLIFNFLNLLFEESLCSSNNSLVRKKLEEWVTSTLTDLNNFIRLFPTKLSLYNFDLLDSKIEYVMGVGINSNVFTCSLADYLINGRTAPKGFHFLYLSRTNEVDSTHLFAIQAVLLEKFNKKYDIDLKKQTHTIQSTAQNN